MGGTPGDGHTCTQARISDNRKRQPLHNNYEGTQYYTTGYTTESLPKKYILAHQYPMLLRPAFILAGKQIMEKTGYEFRNRTVHFAQRSTQARNNAIKVCCS